MEGEMDNMESTPTVREKKPRIVTALFLYGIGLAFCVVGTIVFLQATDTRWCCGDATGSVISFALVLDIIGFLLTMSGVLFGIGGALKREKYAIWGIIFGLLIAFVNFAQGFAVLAYPY
jgi:hypothetical protein